MHELNDESRDELPRWARDAFAWPADHAQGRGAAARAAIMERVRMEPRPLRDRISAPRSAPHFRDVAPRLSPPMRASRWTRRGLLTPFGAAAFAGVLGLLISVRAASTFGGGMLGGAGAPAATTTSAVVISDTVLPSLRDTLRIVEFVLRGPAVHSAAVVGDFNAWRRGATKLEKRGDAWYARVVVPRDVVRFAYAVNDERVGIPAGSPGDQGRQAPRRALRARIDSI